MSINGDALTHSPWGHCVHCGNGIGKTQFAMARQSNVVSFGKSSKSPDDQAYLTHHARSVRARFCSNECWEKGMGAVLEAEGLPASIADKRVLAGPIHPCVKCGTPVNLMKTHLAWVRYKYEMRTKGGAEVEHLDWLDVMGVECKPCNLAASLREKRHRRRATRAVSST